MTEKKFSPDLKVVVAVNSLKSNRSLLLGAIIMLAFFGWMLGYMLFSKGAIQGFWHWMLILALALIVYLMFDGIRRAIVGIRQRQRLTRQGIAIQATVVGHEVDESREEDTYFLYYQFQPDFVVQYQDVTPNQQFFRTPLGDSLSVLYLPEKPELTGVVGG